MDPVNALFWNLVSGRESLKTLPLCSRVDSESAYFAYRWSQHPTPWPLAFDLLTLQCPVTTTMVDYMLVFALQKILCLLGLLGQNILLCHNAERKGIMDNRIRHIILDPPRRAFSFYCLFVYSTQALCTCSSSTYYRPGIWNKACWHVHNGSIWTQIFLKLCQGRRREKWSWTNLNWVSGQSDAHASFTSVFCSTSSWGRYLSLQLLNAPLYSPAGC